MTPPDLTNESPDERITQACEEIAKAMGLNLRADGLQDVQVGDPRGSEYPPIWKTEPLPAYHKDGNALLEAMEALPDEIEYQVQLNRKKGCPTKEKFGVWMYKYPIPDDFKKLVDHFEVGPTRATALTLTLGAYCKAGGKLEVEG